MPNPMPQTDNTLDKEIDRILRPLQTTTAEYKKSQLKSLIQSVDDKAHSLGFKNGKWAAKNEQKKMLEFVIGSDREVKGNYDYQINEEKAEQRQRAKEWEGRNG